MLISTGSREEEKESEQLGLFGEDAAAARSKLEGAADEQPLGEPVESDVEVALNHLNGLTERTGPARFTSPTSIKERIRDGATREDLLLVIDFCYAMWWGDPKMETYIRPKTLFGKENFPEYLVRGRKWRRDGKPPLGNGTARILTQDRDIEIYKAHVKGGKP